jgi:beta-phosphoglucomutase-like phosphatase (HAD superfamily)
MARNAKPAPEQQAIVAWFTRPREREPNGTDGRRAAGIGEPFVPFDIDSDYSRYVDGKPRHDGVGAFLAARSIDLPLGTAEDGPGLQTQHALGNLKDQYFVEHLRQHGVEPYEDAIALMETLRAQDVSVAVVSSSNNSAEVLDAAGITQLFDVRVDGRDIRRLRLHGKPAPDAFLEAARRLGGCRCRGRSSWTMRRPGSRRGTRADWVASSASIAAAASPERCARPGPTLWSPI